MTRTRRTHDHLQINRPGNPAGMLVNTVAFVIVFIFLLFNPELIKSMTLWVTIFVTFSIGVPMYAILYASLKNREYLRDILNK